MKQSLASIAQSANNGWVDLTALPFCSPRSWLPTGCLVRRMSCFCSFSFARALSFGTRVRKSLWLFQQLPEGVRLEGGEKPSSSSFVRAPRISLY